MLRHRTGGSYAVDIAELCILCIDFQPRQSPRPIASHIIAVDEYSGRKWR